VLVLCLFISCNAFASEEPYLLQLVNSENTLQKDFIPKNLVDYKGVKLSGFAKDAFIQMIKAMESDGLSRLKLQSAYRSYAHQKSIFDQRVKELLAKGLDNEHAIEKASESIQKPGSSEHQLGLALDVSINGKLSQEFAGTTEGLWLEENCHKFGFIIRYPQTKTNITHIIYEPWHLRFVGIPHASIMKEQMITLEEYWEFLKGIYKYIFWVSDFEYYLVSIEKSAADEWSINSRFVKR